MITMMTHLQSNNINLPGIQVGFLFLLNNKIFYIYFYSSSRVHQLSPCVRTSGNNNNKNIKIITKNKEALLTALLKISLNRIYHITSKRIYIGCISIPSFIYIFHIQRKSYIIIETLAAETPGFIHGEEPLPPFGFILKLLLLSSFFFYLLVLTSYRKLPHLI